LDQSNPELPDLSDEDSKVLKLGVAAFRRIDKGAHREDWLNIGRSLNTLQAHAMEAAHTTQPVGAHYNAYYAHFARKHHADGMANLEKSVRSHAMWMAREWPVVKTWLDGLPERYRLKLNTPVGIHRAFERATNPRDPLAAKDTVHANLVRAQDEIRILRNARAADEQLDPLVLGTMTPEEIADRIFYERPMEVDQVILALQLRREMQLRRAQDAAKPDGAEEPF